MGGNAHILNTRQGSTYQHYVSCIINYTSCNPEKSIYLLVLKGPNAKTSSMTMWQDIYQMIWQN